MNRHPTDPKWKARFAKVVGMMGSEHSGERSSAAAIATEMLREQGLTWQEYLIDRAAEEPTPEPEPEPEPPPREMDLVETVEWLCIRSNGLDAWQKTFILSIDKQLTTRRPLSDKQIAKVEEIYALMVRKEAKARAAR